MVLRRNTQPIQTRFLPRLDEPPGVTLPSPPVATPPTMPPSPSGATPGLPRTTLPPQTPVQPRTESDTELEQYYNGFVNSADSELEQLGRPVLREGRYFFRSAPLGLEWAGSYKRVPVGRNEQTLEYLFDVEFELDPSLLPVDRRGQLASGAAGMYAPLAPPADQQNLITEERARFELNRLSLEDLNIVKAGLVSIGALDREDFGAPNFRDTQSNPKIQEGFNKIITLAQNNGRDWREMLSDMVINNQTIAPTETTTRGTGTPNLIRLTSPQDLKSVANDVALQTIGRALNDEESQMFVSSYQQQERAYQRQLLGGGEVETPPNLGVAAQSQIQSQFSDEYEMFQMGGVLDQFRAILAGDL